MKKLIAILIGGALAVCVTSGFAVESCVKCHKTMDKVAEAIKKSGAKNADELVDLLRNKSVKKALHKSVKDEDIKKAYDETVKEKEAKKSSTPKKKKVEGC